MKWSKWIWQTHRWLSITLTVLVVVSIVLNFVAPAPEQLALWVGGLTLVPLALLMLAGLYLCSCCRMLPGWATDGPPGVKATAGKPKEAGASMPGYMSRSYSCTTDQ